MRKKNYNMNEVIFDKSKLFIFLVLLYSLFMFISFDFIVASFPLGMSYKGFGENNIGWLISIFGLSIVLWRIYLTKIAKKYGIKFVLLISSIVNIMIPMFYYFFDSFFLILIIRVVHSFAPAGFMFASQMLLINEVGNKKVGRVISYFGVTGSISLIIAPTIGVEMVIRSQDLFFVAAAAKLLGIAALIILLSAYNTKKSFKIKDGEFNRQTSFSIKRIKRLLPLLLHLIFAFSYFGIVSFVTIYATKNNVIYPGIFFAFLASTSIIIRVITGKKLEKGDQLDLLKYFWIITALSYFLLIYVSKLNFIYYVCGMLLGVGLGGIQTILHTVLLRKDSIDKTQSTAGFTNAFDLGSVLGSGAGGVFISLISYEMFFLFMSIIMLLVSITGRKFI